MLITAACQHDSVVYVTEYIYTFFKYSFPLWFIECNSLYYTVGLCCLFILSIKVYICLSQLPTVSFPQPLHFGNDQFVLYVHDSVSVL